MRWLLGLQLNRQALCIGFVIGFVIFNVILCQIYAARLSWNQVMIYQRPPETPRPPSSTSKDTRNDHNLEPSQDSPQNIFEFALSKLNPQNINYGDRFEALRMAFLNNTLFSGARVTIFLLALALLATVTCYFCSRETWNHRIWKAAELFAVIRNENEQLRTLIFEQKAELDKAIALQEQMIYGGHALGSAGLKNPDAMNGPTIDAKIISDLKSARDTAVSKSKKLDGDYKTLDHEKKQLEKQLEEKAAQLEKNQKRLDELDARLRQILETQVAKRTTPEHLQRIDQLEEDLALKENQIAELERALAAKEKEQSNTQSMIHDLSETNVQLRAQVETLEAELKPYRHE